MVGMNQRIRLICLLSLFVAFFPAHVNAQTEFPPAYNNQAHYAVGDLVTDYGNIYRCEAAVTKPYLDPSKIYSNWELFYVRSNTTLPIGVGQTFPTLEVAWNYMRNSRVARAAYLHLSISTANGPHSESFSAPLSLDMDTGAQVSIIGDSISNVLLSFPTTNGLIIDSGHCFGSISNLTVVANGGNDLYAGSSGSIANIDSVTLKGSQTHVYAERLGSVVFGNNIVMIDSQTNGCFADTGASITFPSGGLNATGVNQSGSLLTAQNGARIIAEGSALTDAGYAASVSWGGIVDVTGATISNCFIGCQALYNGTIQVEDANLVSNTGGDLLASNGGVIDAFDLTTTKYSATNGGAIYFG